MSYCDAAETVLLRKSTSTPRARYNLPASRITIDSRRIKFLTSKSNPTKTRHHHTFTHKISGEKTTTFPCVLVSSKLNKLSLSITTILNLDAFLLWNVPTSEWKFGSKLRLNSIRFTSLLLQKLTFWRSEWSCSFSSVNPANFSLLLCLSFIELDCNVFNSLRSTIKSACNSCTRESFPSSKRSTFNLSSYLSCSSS